MPAPYSDNLYSADSSDDEPDLLSPTDGYFRASSSSAASHTGLNLPRVPNVLVQDPTVAGQDSKARELERERHLLNSGGSDNTDNAPGLDTPRQGAGEENQTSMGGLDSSGTAAASSHTQPSHHRFAHHFDAPPAYTPSPISPSAPSNYQTFPPSSTMGHEPEQQSPISHEPEQESLISHAPEQQPLISHAPESMSSPSNADKPSRWQRFKDCVASFNLRRKFKTALGCLVVFSVIFMILSSFTGGSGGADYEDPDRAVDHDPVQLPDRSKDFFNWKPSGVCLDKPYRFETAMKVVDLQYKRNLTIVQTDDQDGDDSGRAPHVSGEIVLRAETGSRPGNVQIEVISNNQKLSAGVTYDEKTQHFKISTPKKVAWGLASSAPCIQIRVTVSVRRESVINALAIDTQHLGIRVKEGLILGVMENAVIRTTAGNVNTPAIDDESRVKAVFPYSLSAREMHIHTTSGDVRGWYPLYDLLDIKTVSGDVDSTVWPKNAKPELVKPAKLRVHSTSGTIRLEEPIDRALRAPRPAREFATRDYHVDVLTASGDTTATLAAGTRVRVGSQSGDFDLRLWPVFDSALLATEGELDEPVWETDTKSGYTQLTVLEPLYAPPYSPRRTIPLAIYDDAEDETEQPPPEGTSIDNTPAISLLTSTHKSISGDIKLRYPSAWEGHLSAQSISGEQDFRGEGLKITHSGGPAARLVKGTKGTGNSQLDVKSVSGDQDVLIGAEV
ncbi:hypothetical protein FZEAL_6793 [Fusarium zealandicum]|uniref:Adhesin domain-containing protein n=1 Tax=Fusarium zealandicum TaxID=1053134 RepID=A0A8H4UH32_9HYPO|nr:hypothetical protein FZEAL_6793 [Fusarium zealandicum]